MPEIKNQKVNWDGIAFESMDQFHKYYAIESAWIDEEFRKNWPWFYSKFARWANKKMNTGQKLNILARIATVILAKTSRMTIHRNKAMEVLGMGGKGFRPGHEKVFTRSVTVKLLKGKKEMAQKEIKLTIL